MAFITDKVLAFVTDEGLPFINDEALEFTVDNLLKVVLEGSNVIMGIVGVMILWYWVWLFFYCFWNCKKYLFASWFVWACFGLGTMFSFTACTGFVAAASMSALLLSCYSIFMCLLLLMEGIFALHVFLNKKWYQFFPKDKTSTFELFLTFVQANHFFFKSLGRLFLVSQVVSFLGSVVLRIIGNELNYDISFATTMAELFLS